MKLNEIDLQNYKLSHKKQGSENTGFYQSEVFYPERITYNTQPLYEEFKIKNWSVIKNFSTLEIKHGTKVVAKTKLQQITDTVNIENNYVSSSRTENFIERAEPYIDSVLTFISIYEYVREQLAEFPNMKFKDLTEEQKELFNKIYEIKDNLETLLSNGNVFRLDDSILLTIDPTEFLNVEEINKFIKEQYKVAEQLREEAKIVQQELEEKRKKLETIKQEKTEEKRKKKEAFIQKTNGIVKKVGDAMLYCAKPLISLTSIIKKSVTSAKEQKYAKKKRIEAELKYKKRTELNK